MEKGRDEFVRRRAGHICEYCHLSQANSRLRLVIDHVLARQHGGATTSENLALCCAFCNQHKGPNVAGVDPQTNRVTPLFNPRNDAGADNFSFKGATLVGLTATGRTTIAVLNMNSERQLAVRQAILDESV